MLNFMDYVQSAFYSASRWTRDNSYASLNDTPNALLNFSLPHGVTLNVSSLSSPNFATSYTFGSKGVVDGSLSFLYTSVEGGLKIPTRSADVRLERLVRGYGHLQQLVRPEDSDSRAIWYRGKRVDRKDFLLYGRLYLPDSTLEALYLRRLSPTRLLRLNCVSHSDLPNGGAVLATLANDHGKYSTEYLYSTDSSLVGMRGLYNFGFDPRLALAKPNVDESQPAHPWDHQNGRLSAGAEAYFSPVNKSGGISTGIRFSTLPIHGGFPYTMTLTLNPLMGNLSSTYAVKAGANLALCSRFDFNFYSYESDVVVGMELWRRRQAPADVAWAKRLIREGWQPASEEVDGVLKARIDQNGRAGILWEARIQELLVSAGAGLDFRQRDRLVGSLGVEISYSS
ncbi:hypothetical protein K431DRAFT_349019 [Polychaeton citri CBS 116435]|uniref:Mitochondrial distribution and morphology protein 10 n=1 Tax=Polychaeton citri CBS 116435 TaxID=1314669 RepID=A0A9P4Q1N8_9PEZI|nr:hypothetical protein K431DRAFT_349019 [Polychaeton citri CBS 116435]